MTLGLSPPYTLEDVKAAYYSKAQRLHPDHGGSADGFHRLHEAFEQAQEYVAYRGDRRAWIAGKLEGYVSLLEATERIEALGGSASSVTMDWMERSIGDFAQLTQMVTRIRLVDSTRGDEFVHVLLEELPVLKHVHAIELPGCRVSDNAILSLRAYSELRRLDLSRTPITPRALGVVEALPHLQTLLLDGTSIGWWTRRRVARRIQRRANKKAKLFGMLPDFLPPGGGAASEA